MARSNKVKRPSFFWQGLMILLPVLVLAVVGLFSLGQDEQVAEQTARKKAAEDAASLNRAMGDAALEFGRYYRFQNIWMGELRAVPMGSGSAGPESARELKHWEELLPGLNLAALATPLCAVTYDGFPISPRDFPQAPLPSAWFCDLSLNQRRAWETLRQTEAETAGNTSVSRAWNEFLQTDPLQDALLAASNYARLNGPEWDRGSYSGLTEAGARFQDLWCYKALTRGVPGQWSRVLEVLGSDIESTPSLMTPTLLQVAIERTTNDTPTQNRLSNLEQIWDGDARARQYLVVFRRHPEFLSINKWVKTSAGDSLALPDDNIHPNSPNTIPSIGFVPRQVVEAIFSRALTQNRFLAPDYATPVVTIEGEPIPFAGRDFVPDEKTRLASISQTIDLTPGASKPLTIGVSLYLTSREKMLAEEQRRARLFGALIGAAVLAAVAGFLTARRAFYQQHRLAEMKTNFVSSVSHELRAPIASMRLLAEALERGKVSSPEKQQEYYRFLVQESGRLTSLIENILDFSRIEQGRKDYRFEPADLGLLARQTFDLMVPYAAGRGVPLVWRPGAGPAPQLSCDGLAIQQALINLIDNAIKHSPAGIAVDIGIETADGSVRLWVEDRGPGIPPAEHERIFERFYRRGSELRRETQGVGIGLTIVKHIVESHGGRVLVRSGDGEGSRFTIELPLKRE